MSTKTVICPRSALRFCIPWLVLSLSCSSGDRLGGSKSGDSTVASHAQALTGTPPPICIFGESLVSVGAATNIHSDVGSNNSVAVQAGWGPDLPTLVAGDITSAGTVDLYGGDSNVAGTVRANGKITQQTGALADEVDPFTSQTVLQHDIPGKAVNPGTTSVTVEPGTGCVGNVLSPRPDQYGWVTVRRGCSLTLTPGEYHFASLDIDADATLIIQGPVKVFTQWGFRFADRAQLQGVLSPYDLQVYSGSSATIGNYVQDFRGILTAEQRVTVGT